MQEHFEVFEEVAAERLPDDMDDGGFLSPRLVARQELQEHYSHIVAA